MPDTVGVSGVGVGDDVGEFVEEQSSSLAPSIPTPIPIPTAREIMIRTKLNTITFSIPIPLPEDFLTKNRSPNYFVFIK